MRELSQVALDRLAEVRKHILDEPARFRMDTWVQEDDGPACKTVGCLAGWLVLCDVMKKNGMDARHAMYADVEFCSVEERGRKLLDLTYAEDRALFVLAGWPSEYRQQYSSEGDYTIHDGEDPAFLEDILVARRENAELLASLISSVIDKRAIWWVKAAEPPVPLF